MLLSEQEQKEFFSNYLPLLYYAAMYEGLLPEGATLIDFGNSSVEIKVQSRDALFADQDILNYFRKDNGSNLPEGGDVFLDNVEQGLHSDFVVLKQYKAHAVLHHINDLKFYHVLNITDSFSELLSYIPNYINTAIFNFNGKIICDGLIKGGNIHIGPNNEKSLLEEYRACKTRKEIIMLL